MFPNSERKNSVEIKVNCGSWKLNFRRAVFSEESKVWGHHTFVGWAEGLESWGWGKELSDTSRHPDSGRRLREKVGVQWTWGHPRGSWCLCAVRGMRWETPYFHDTIGCGMLPPPPTVYLQVNWGAQSRIQASRISSSVGAARKWPMHECIHHCPCTTPRSTPLARQTVI